MQFDSLYVDGVQVSTSTNTENMAANQTFGNNTLYLMSDGGADTYSAGRLMNFNIHAGTGAIGLGDIGALYRAPWSMFRAAAPLYTPQTRRPRNRRPRSTDTSCACEETMRRAQPVRFSDGRQASARGVGLPERRR